MNVGEVRPVTTGDCEDLYVIETGMYDVTGYGGVYVLDTDRPAIVETGIGTNVEHVLAAIDSIGIDLSAIEVIAVTHIHLDHAGGAGYLAEACPNAHVYVHEIGAPHLVDPERLVAGTKQAVGEQWRHYVDPQPIPADRVTPIAEGASIDLGNQSLHPYHVPGHAAHQVVYHVPEMDAVFTGDAAGLWIPAREIIHQTSPPPEFTLEQAVADLAVIHSLDPSTLLYTHFGPAVYDRERLDGYAETLKTWVAAVKEARTTLSDDEAVIEHFCRETDLGPVWSEEKARAETSLNVRGVLTYLDRQED